MATELFLLEDTDAVSTHAITGLEALGFQVRVERNANQALTYLTSKPRNFRAILTDGHLGTTSESGMYFIEKLWEIAPQYRDLPVIGGSSVPIFWKQFDAEGFYRVDKVFSVDDLMMVWDIEVVFTTLADLSIHP